MSRNYRKLLRKNLKLNKQLKVHTWNDVLMLFSDTFVLYIFFKGRTEKVFSNAVQFVIPFISKNEKCLYNDRMDLKLKNHSVAIQLYQGK
jgi:hypothetical protein